jgi:hypothetical protein
MELLEIEHFCTESGTLSFLIGQAQGYELWVQ